MPTTSRRPREKMWIRRNKGRWTSEEHAAFLHGLRLFQRDNWAAVASVVPTRTVLQVRTHAQKYFNKVDKGEEFPEEPYPSQYDTDSGKSGAAAGAYLYGVPRHDQQQQQHQPRETAGASTSTELPLMCTPQPLDGGVGRRNFGGVVVPELRFPSGLLIYREHQQRVAAVSVASAAAGASAGATAAGYTMPLDADDDYVVPHTAYSSPSYGSGGGGGGSSSSLFPPLTQGNTGRGFQHSHTYPTAASVGVESVGLCCSGGVAGQPSSTSAEIMNMPEHGSASSIGNVTTSNRGRSGSCEADASTYHSTSNLRRSGNHGSSTSAHINMGPASSPATFSWAPYTFPPPSPFRNSTSSADASAARSVSSFAADGDFAPSCSGSFQQHGSSSPQDGSGGDGFPQRSVNGAQHHERTSPPQLQPPPTFGGPVIRDGASSIDFGKTSSQQQEGQALDGLYPFDGWLDMPLLGDGDYPCGEFDTRNNDDNGIMGADGGDIGLEDFGVL